MDIKWISVNSNLENGIKLLNNLTTTKFKLILVHISQSTGGELFTEDELKQLRDSLRLTETNLQLLIQTINHILNQACKVILIPTDMEQQLVDILKFHPDKADVFVKVWAAYTGDIFGEFGDRVKLDDVVWEVNLKTASNSCSKQTEPSARIQLYVKSITGDEKDGVLLDMDEKELTQFYYALEKIQTKLDNIQNSAR